MNLYKLPRFKGQNKKNWDEIAIKDEFFLIWRVMKFYRNYNINEFSFSKVFFYYIILIVVFFGSIIESFLYTNAGHILSKNLRSHQGLLLKDSGVILNGQFSHFNRQKRLFRFLLMENFIKIANLLL